MVEWHQSAILWNFTRQQRGLKLQRHFHGHPRALLCQLSCFGCRRSPRPSPPSSRLIVAFFQKPSGSNRRVFLGGHIPRRLPICFNLDLKQTPPRPLRLCGKRSSLHEAFFRFSIYAFRNPQSAFRNYLNPYLHLDLPTEGPPDSGHLVDWDLELLPP